MGVVVMRSSSAAVLVTVLFLAMGFAGCTSDEKPFDPESVIAYFERAQQLGYPAHVTTDATGKVLDATVGDNASKVIQTMLEWEGSNPGLAINSKGTVFVTGFDKVHRTRDVGAKWEVARKFESPEFPQTQDKFYSLETLLHADPKTDRLFLFHANVGVRDPSNTVFPIIYQWPWISSCPSLYWTIDEGAIWHQSSMPDDAPGSMSTNPGSCASPTGGYSWSSHPKIFTGAPVSGTLPSGGGTGPLAYNRVLYLCDVLVPRRVVGQQLPPVAKCSMSYDSGESWERTTVIEPPINGCTILNIGKPAVSSDGVVYLPLVRHDGRQFCDPGVAISTDEGNSWTLQFHPGKAHAKNIDWEPQLAIAPDGKTVYFVYRAENHGIYVMRSSDRFGTWKGPFRVSPLTHELNVYPTMVAGSAGRVAFGYLGTTDYQDRDLDPPTPPRAHKDSVWNAYVTTSYDIDAESPTFVTDQANIKQDPVSIGCVGLQYPWFGDPATDDAKGFVPAPECALNLGHRFAMDLSMDGRVVFVFPDGCNVRNDCILDFSSGFQARDRQLSFAVQDRGHSLMESLGDLPELGLLHPVPAPKGPGESEA